MTFNADWVAASLVMLYMASILIFTGVFIGGSLRQAARVQSLNRRSQQLPCGNCRYFSGEVALKCAVQPGLALTPEAATCRDFEPLLDHKQLPLPSVQPSLCQCTVSERDAAKERSQPATFNWRGRLDADNQCADD
ncbi:MAG: hypothetical protein AAF728_01500 [Cyanobacteria bacterium P01_D01_bin.128]